MLYMMHARTRDFISWLRRRGWWRVRLEVSAVGEGGGGESGCGGGGGESGDGGDATARVAAAAARVATATAAARVAWRTAAAARVAAAARLAVLALYSTWLVPATHESRTRGHDKYRPRRPTVSRSTRKGYRAAAAGGGRDAASDRTRPCACARLRAIDQTSNAVLQQRQRQA